MIYEVFAPTVRHQPDWLLYGTTISRHRTREAAQAAIDRANRRLRAQGSHMRNSWLDLAIRVRKGGCIQ